MKRLWMIIALPLACLISVGRGSGLNIRKTSKRLWADLAPTKKRKQKH